MNRKFGISKLRSAVGIGAASLIVLAGVSLIGVGAASAAATLAFASAPTSGTAGVAFGTFTVTETSGTATDAILLSSSCGNVSGGTNPVTSSGGVATFTGIILDTAGAACTLTATDQTSGGTQQTSAFVESPAAVTKLAFTTAPPSTAGASVVLTTFKVSSEDPFGNVATSGADTTDTITISSSCTLGGTLAVPEVAGVATFSAVAITQTGSCILIATDTTNNSGVTATSSGAISVSGGTPAKLAFTVAPPASVLTTGTVITAFKVAVEDASGNIDVANAGSGDSITVSSPCLAASVTATAVAGVATFSTADFSTTGLCTLTATDTSRVVTAATATSTVGEAQGVLTVTTKSGYLDAPLTLVVTGGSGTGLVTFTVTNGTATDCAITSGVLTAKSAGTCTVTAYKAAVTPYAPATSVATTVTISSAPKAVRLVGAIWNARKTTVTVTGYNFIGRPKITSNVAGFTAIVSSDSGKSLRIVVTVKGSASKPGVKVMTIRLANGKTTSVRYSLH
jgi:hypothetical protein